LSLRERFDRQHLSKHRGRIILCVVTSLSIVSSLPALGNGGQGTASVGEVFVTLPEMMTAFAQKVSQKTM
jgi:hypothetical protein